MAGPVLLHSASFERTVTMMLGLIACLYLFATVVSTHFQLDPTSSIDTHGRHGGVVSGSAPCSDIGINVLRKGGNAADAVSPEMASLRNCAFETELRGNGRWSLPSSVWASQVRLIHTHANATVASLLTETKSCILRGSEAVGLL